MAKIVEGRTRPGRARKGAEPEDLTSLEASAAEHLLSNKAKAVKLYQKVADLREKRGEEKEQRRLLDIAATVIADEGWELREEGQPSKARRKALKALEIYPAHIDAKNLLALIHMKDFEYNEAKGFYEQAIADATAGQGGSKRLKGVRYWSELETRPYMRALHGYGFCLAYLGRHREALDQFDLLLRLDHEDHVGARFLLADLYHFIGNTDKAEKYYREYGSFEAPFTHALLLRALGRGPEARLMLKKAFNKSQMARMMLTDYLYCFVLWESLDSYAWGTFPAIALHSNALETAYNANAAGIENPDSAVQLEAAYNFCNLCGPLWLKYEGSYEFLKESHPIG